MRFFMLVGWLCSLVIAGAGRAEAQAPIIEQRCGDAVVMLRYAMQGVRAENTLYSLKRAGQTYHMLIISRVDRSRQNSTGHYAPWRLLQRQGQTTDYCLVATGSRLDSMVSLHMSSPRGRYGVPGSGYQRCSNTGSVPDALDVRMWANRELGESFVVQLYAETGARDFTYLMADDLAWILLDQERGTSSFVTCFNARGDDNTSHTDFRIPTR